MSFRHTNPARQPLSVKNAQPAQHGSNVVSQQQEQLSKVPSATAVGKQPQRPSHVVLTPKKRAVPQEDVHCRNVIYSPSKRSRSSKHGSSNTDQATEPSTGTALTQGFGSFKVADTGREHVTRATSARMTNPTTNARPTTTRIDKHSRMTDAERAARDRVKQQETEIWKVKYRKAFPQFVFYLDSFDEATRANLTESLRHLGGTVEPFFSKSVTHLVTTRTIPAHSLGAEVSKESSQKATSLSLALSQEASRKSAKVPSTSRPRLSPVKTAPDGQKNRTIPLHSDRNPFDEPGPPLPANDVLRKAQSFGIKVWKDEKLNSILALLLDGPRGEGGEGSRQDLSQMLQQEKLHGTLERDPTAHRGDYYYFSKNSCYVLVEDATMEHRPIMVQEYERPTAHEEPPWPILYGELEGRCPFTYFEVNEDKRRRTEHNTYQTLRRTVSLNYINQRGVGLSPQDSNRGHGKSNIGNASPFLAASGNSVAITSNIASTTSTAFNSQAGFGGVSMLQDKRVAQLGRRMHTPFALVTPPIRASGGASGLGISGGGIGSGSGSSNAAVTPAPDLSRGAVVRRMLGMTEQRTGLSGMRRSVSTGTAARPRREEPKKPGYCENCRARFEDFEEHVRGRRHRKFACDDAHFIEIDNLIRRVQRPLAPELSQYGDESAETDSLEIDYSGAPAWQDQGSDWSHGRSVGSASPGDQQYHHEQGEHTEGCSEQYEEYDEDGESEEQMTPNTSVDADEGHHRTKLPRPALDGYVVGYAQ